MLCDGGGQGEGGSKGQGQIYTQLIRTVAQEKLIQHCKAIILQQKNLNKIKNIINNNLTQVFLEGLKSYFFKKPGKKSKLLSPQTSKLFHHIKSQTTNADIKR